MSWNAATVTSSVARAFQGAADHADELNMLDAALGDGDLGETVDRGAAATQRVAAGEYSTVADGLRGLAAGLASASGSSLATAVAVGFTGAADALGEATCLGRETLPLAIEGALSAVLDLGQVARGDKTVMDGLFAAQDAIIASPSLSLAQLAANVLDAVKQESERLRAQPFRVGRGRVYGERGRGLQDPGMVAFIYAIEAMASEIGD